MVCERCKYIDSKIIHKKMIDNKLLGNNHWWLCDREMTIKKHNYEIIDNNSSYQWKYVNCKKCLDIAYNSKTLRKR